MSARGLALAVCLLAPLRLEADPRPPRIAETGDPSRRSGLLGLGLGLELGMVGVTAGFAERSHQGVGWNLGAGLSWDILPALTSHLFLAGGQVYGGRADVRFLDGGVLTTKRQDVDWVGVEVGGGFAYLWPSSARTYAPYLGFDAALAYGGYEFRFGNALERRLTEPIDTSVLDPDCRGARCVAEPHGALAWSVSAGPRVGVRLYLLSWLLSQAELQLSYWPLPAEPVAATYTSLEVRSRRDAVWLVRSTFTVRLGL